ncbi:MAG: hypothetical protein GF383_01285 [Candidatus Lokiarchaeota archaeon]|nr:hypothetical protein [Candidatus Lokiarchaeota archaeon]MBD3337895.1 hypothetical protein [Candidatus Lokiarchaeota archaeon]
MFEAERPIPEAVLVRLQFRDIIDGSVGIGDFWTVEVEDFQDLIDLKTRYGDFCIKPGKEFGMDDYFLLFLR